jgi:hypothetical protein
MALQALLTRPGLLAEPDTGTPTADPAAVPAYGSGPTRDLLAEMGDARAVWLDPAGGSDSESTAVGADASSPDRSSRVRPPKRLKSRKSEGMLRGDDANIGGRTGIDSLDASASTRHDPSASLLAEHPRPPPSVPATGKRRRGAIAAADAAAPLLQTPVLQRPLVQAASSSLLQRGKDSARLTTTASPHASPVRGMPPLDAAAVAAASRSSSREAASRGKQGRLAKIVDSLFAHRATSIQAARAQHDADTLLEAAQVGGRCVHSSLLRHFNARSFSHHAGKHRPAASCVQISCATAGGKHVPHREGV